MAESNSPNVRVLIVEDDLQVITDLTAMLTRRRYALGVAQGIGQELIADAKSLAQKFRPHVAIVDLRLLDEYADERSGLVLLAELASAQCILYSAHLSPEVMREAEKKYNVKNCISKHEHPQMLLDALAESARERCCARREDLQLHPPADWERTNLMQTLLPDCPDAPPDLVGDALAQLFPSNKNVAFTFITSPTAHAPAASRGRSVVFKAYPDSLQPVIIKLAIGKRVADETKNYAEHIRGHLGGQFHAQLEHHAIFWDLGGTVYNFLSSKVDTIDTFTHFYNHNTDPQIILEPLRHFFGEVWGDYYAQPLKDFENRPLFAIYAEALDLTKHLHEFKNKEERRYFADLAISFPNPVHWIEQHHAESFIDKAHYAITHGDLHGDNLFTDGEHTWAIDFERTGPSHALRDFAELEVDLLTRLVPATVNLPTFFALAVALVTPATPQPQVLKLPAHIRANSDANKAFQVIEKLREIAHDKIKAHDIREHYWGLLLDALFVATLPEDSTNPSKTRQRERALLLGAILCERLNRWHDEWPPKIWRAQLAAKPKPPTGKNTRAGKTTFRPNQPCDVFLSYNRQDQKSVKEYAARLKKADLRFWMDTSDLAPGDMWRDEIEQALRDCRACLVFIGKAGLGATQKREVGIAQDRQTRDQEFRVIPLLLPGAQSQDVPPFLAQSTWVDFRKGFDAVEWERLLQTLAPKK